MRALSLATIAVAIAGYAVILVAARGLSASAYEDFMVYWGLFFALAGLLDGLLQETARAVTARRSGAGFLEFAPDAQAAPAAPFHLTSGFAVVSGLLAAATAPWWAPVVSPDLQIWGSVLMVVGLVAYAFQATVCGLISAASKWTIFAWLIAFDSLIRLALAVWAWLMGWQLLAFLLVTVIGAATWLLFLLISPGTRALLSEKADVGSAAFVNRCLKAMVASGANAMIITGFPVLLRFTSDADVAAGALAATITAVTLTRAPILVPMQRFQPALIVHFTKHRDNVLRACLVPMLAVIAVAAFGGAAAYFLGQTLMGLFFAEELVVSASALAVLTVASGSTALLMITGSAALAADRHTLYVAGWIVATIACIALLLVDTSAEMRSALSLGIGPLVGVALQVAVLARGERREKSKPQRARAGNGGRK